MGENLFLISLFSSVIASIKEGSILHIFSHPFLPFRTMTRGGFAMTIHTLLARRRSSRTSKAMVGRFMSKVARGYECYDHDEETEVQSQSLKHKVQGEKKEYHGREEEECWIPHRRTGIYYPKGHEWVMEDVPDGAACFAYSYWLRNSDRDGV